MYDIKNISHPQMVKVLVKPPEHILESLTPDTVDLWHAATGISGEAGELLDAIATGRKNNVYDITNIQEELGDLYFYVEQVSSRAKVAIDFDAAWDATFSRVMSPDMAIVYAVEVSVYASQVLDTVKKAAIYNKPIDLSLLTEQLGKLAVSVQSISFLYGLSRQQCLDANIAKLRERYTNLVYSDQQAQQRADKLPRTPGMIEHVEGQQR